MIYRKNLYTWEQALRLLLGIAMIAVPFTLSSGNIWVYVLMATGIVLIVTAIFGYCPICAAFGRTLKPKS